MQNSVEKNNGQRNGKIEVSNKLSRAGNSGIFMSISAKAQKISTAVYMLSDLITDTDPMRHSMRRLSLKILSDSRALSYDLTGDLYFHLGKIIANTWGLISLIEISTNVGFISDMNYQVIKTALIGFIGDLRNRQRIEGFKTIDELKTNASEPTGFSLKEEFFVVKDEDLKEDGAGVSNKIKPETIKDTTIYKGQLPKATSGDMAERKNQIYLFIQENKDVSINDIISHFNGFGKKTVQRDLIALMVEGKLKRTGEKRWSRYSLPDDK